MKTQIQPHSVPGLLVFQNHEYSLLSLGKLDHSFFSVLLPAGKYYIENAGTHNAIRHDVYELGKVFVNDQNYHVVEYAQPKIKYVLTPEE